jgi:hypothetical protein
LTRYAEHLERGTSWTDGDELDTLLD